MASDTYIQDCIVLKKTKLGEADLILTFINSSGEKCQGIAKGARKPQSTFSSYLELGNVVHILFARGKKLDVITDVRLEESYPKLKSDAFRFAAASCILEMALKITEENLEQPRIFEMTCSALHKCEEMNESYLAYLVSAYLLKSCSMSGIRPSISSCAACGSDISINPSKYVSFSYVDGGALCEHCANMLEHISVRGDYLLCIEALVSSKFDDISNVFSSAEYVKSMLEMSHKWVSVHTASHIKSIEMLELYC